MKDKVCPFCGGRMKFTERLRMFPKFFWFNELFCNTCKARMTMKPRFKDN